MLTAIPSWNHQGLLNPIDPSNPVSLARSPYVVSLVEFVRHFAKTAERSKILDGLLRYRAALHQAGLTSGFQWLDGSFLENKELLQGLPPGDIDVVTFFHVPTGETQAQVAALFGSDGDAIKRHYHVDAYLEPLQKPPERLIPRCTYWYGMWAHQRNTFLWKGFLQVDLLPAEDAAARLALQTTLGGGIP